SHASPQSRIVIEPLSVFFPFQKIRADKSRFPIEQQVLEVVPRRHKWHTAREHRFYGGAAPGLSKVVAQGIDEKIQTLQKIDLRLLFCRKQIPALIEPEPAVFQPQVVVPGHHPISRVRQFQAFVENRKILRIFQRIRSGESANLKRVVLTLLEWEEVR